MRVENICVSFFSLQFGLVANVGKSATMMPDELHHHGMRQRQAASGKRQAASGKRQAASGKRQRHQGGEPWRWRGGNY